MVWVTLFQTESNSIQLEIILQALGMMEIVKLYRGASKGYLKRNLQNQYSLPEA